MLKGRFIVMYCMFYELLLFMLNVLFDYFFDVFGGEIYYLFGGNIGLFVGVFESLDYNVVLVVILVSVCVFDEVLLCLFGYCDIFFVCYGFYFEMFDLVWVDVVFRLIIGLIFVFDFSFFCDMDG